MLTRRYEEALAPAGMSVSQFELMRVIETIGSAGQARLAAVLDADQTTLSRNLAVLVGLRWVESTKDERDGRRQSYRLSRLGVGVLREAVRCWEQVHEEMQRRLGMPMAELWPLLERVMEAAR